MNLPVWTKPALLGAGAGAIALAIVGFSWGGWVTAGSAADLADKQSSVAVAEALTPYCVERSKTSANSFAVMAELKDASAYSRRGIIEKAGWATAPGEEKANTMLAQACQLKLAEL